ncbi:hypothetical protein PAXRUDRAFT_823814 [Paxillus rubicundulus Ve08.2h10]|uniref:Uncharacterized protein n=1 Tax=Paxillus rubicundulus Ve08.2h10 TaxID=930991 RepID=A0A0D0DJF2_9AGAM|nr:hypothetical protein PAXRUDRAFT_823814 [Paxillus rubicundulus Ve08.2h10]
MTPSQSNTDAKEALLAPPLVNRWLSCILQFLFLGYNDIPQYDNCPEFLFVPQTSSSH